MTNLQYKNQKKPLVYTKNAIDNAARDIRHGVGGKARVDAINKIQSFREYHLYPLMLLKNHLTRVSSSISNKVIVARRLKMLSTIVDKLERPTLDGSTSNSIKLTRMQDIAGCRAIVKNIKQLKQLQHKLEVSRSVHKIVSVKDYLTPKDSGYGGVHIIYSCYENQAEDHDWKKAKVEVQLRTELQHAWATSLEIIDTLERINLKTSHEGHEEWREFFSIAGKLVAHTEGACTIEDADYLLNLRKRFADLSETLSVSRKLAEYALAISFTTNNKVKNRGGKKIGGMYLVCIKDGEEGKFNVMVNHYDNKKSNAALNDLNKADLDESIIISVLVSASDVMALKKAYPNFFGSTRQFKDFIDTQKIKSLVDNF